MEQGRSTNISAGSPHVRYSVRHFAPQPLAAKCLMLYPMTLYSLHNHHTAHQLPMAWKGTQEIVLARFARSGELEDLGLFVV